jgi:AcrR family transcriptional regulator
VPAEVSEWSRIMDAAYRCLASSNGGSVSVTDILRTAGLSTRAFYRHFESKDNLLLAMFRRDSERVLTELQSSATAAADPRDALRNWIEGFLRLTIQSRRRQRVLILSSEELMRANGYAAERARSMAAHQAGIAQILHRGLEDGSFPLAEPGPDARAIRAVLSEAFTELMSNSATMTAAEAADEVTGFAFRALGAAKG